MAKGLRDFPEGCKGVASGLRDFPEGAIGLTHSLNFVYSALPTRLRKLEKIDEPS